MKSVRVKSDPGLGSGFSGANSGTTGRDEEVGHHHPSDLPACGLLRMDAKLWLWLLASDTDLDKYGFLVLLLLSYLPDDGEGLKSIFFVCDLIQECEQI